MAESVRPVSLARRLLLLLLAATAGVWAVALVATWLDARHEIGEMLDAHLVQAGSLILAQAGHDLEEIDTEHAPQLHRYGRRVAFQLWERGRILRLHSANAPQVRLSGRDEGFSDVKIDGRRWRVFSGWDQRRRTLVQVGEQQDGRDEIAGAVVKRMLVPTLAGLPVLALLVWLAIARGLRPLRDLGAEVARRDPSHLAPVGAQDVPAEVRPLVESLNRLFGRVAASIETERRFTADAAHELRTPLAALRGQAQVARAATDADERRRALDHVIAACDRAAHLVDQLLTAARVDPATASARFVDCDLAAIARAVAGELAPAALEKGVELECDAQATVPLRADPGMLAILLRNLVDNAVRYSPAGTTVRVQARCDGASAVVAVNDEGPGVPADEREHVWQRFYRIPGTAEAGSGLGLSIVARIAELHAGIVRLEDGTGGRGLRVVAVFPVAQAGGPEGVARD